MTIFICFICDLFLFHCDLFYCVFPGFFQLYFGLYVSVYFMILVCEITGQVTSKLYLVRSLILCVCLLLPSFIVMVANKVQLNVHCNIKKYSELTNIMLSHFIHFVYDNNIELYLSAYIILILN